MATLTHDRFADVAPRARRTAPKPPVLAGLLATLKLWRRRIEERNALAAFGWRDMSDIGISQSEVMHEIAKPFWKA